MLLCVCRIFDDCNFAIRFRTRHKFVDCSFVIRRNFVDCSLIIRICSRDNSIWDGICWGLVDVGHLRLMPLKALTLETVLTKPLQMMTTPT